MAEVNGEIKLWANLKCTGGDIKVEIVSDTGKVLGEMDALSPDHAALLDLMELRPRIQLLQWEHDLDESCCCTTCYGADEIRRLYGHGGL